MRLLAWGLFGWLIGIAIVWAWAYWDIFLRGEA